MEVKMNTKLFKEKYRAFNLTEEKINEYIQTVLNFEDFINDDIDKATISHLKDYVNYLIDNDLNNYNNLVHVARYFYYINKQEIYIRLTQYFNAVGVLENILDRIVLYDSQKLQDEIKNNIKLPPFGTDPDDLPQYTRDFMEKLNKYLPRSKCNKILAGNNHKIPKESFDKEREYYQEATSLKAYLKNRHERKIQELTRHFEENKVWFEQIITPEVIEHVKSNQEILSGVLKDNKLYITKIPYDVNNYLQATNEKRKRYYACHCSFVRENILKEKENIPREWCYCSGGYAKFPFEQILEQELDITLLETPIDGGMECRFVIDLANINYK